MNLSAWTSRTDTPPMAAVLVCVGGAAGEDRGELVDVLLLLEYRQSQARSRTFRGLSARAYRKNVAPNKGLGNVLPSRLAVTFVFTFSVPARRLGSTVYCVTHTERATKNSRRTSITSSPTLLPLSRHCSFSPVVKRSNLSISNIVSIRSSNGVMIVLLS